MYHDLYLGGKALVERENVGFDLAKSDLCPSFVEDHTAKGVGLRVADSHTGKIILLLFVTMSAKHIIRTPTCILMKEELSNFLSIHPLPSEYKIMLPNPDGYIGLYTHCFSLTNLRLPLLKFFCDVLQYFKVHLSRLNPFGCAKLTTFVVMCKAYGCEPTVEFCGGFFSLFPGGQWLIFSKRPKKHILNLLPNVITRIEGWKGRFFFVLDSIVPVDCLELISKDNRWDTKSFKDKLPPIIHENPSF
ncbi:hypothetical protein Tco_1316222 [Tanacetum coccineum]